MTEGRRAGGILSIDISAVVENWKRVCRTCGHAEVSAVVKTGAYGLGARRIASALAWAGCRSFYVAHIEEGIALRQVLSAQKIYVLHGPWPGTEEDFLAHDLIPVLSTPWQIAMWRRVARKAGRTLPVAIHADTGMTRLGLPSADFDELLKQPERLSGLSPEIFMSHLACAETPSHPKNNAQRAAFEKKAEAFQKLWPSARLSLANSAGTFLGAEYQFDQVRPGIALYGWTVGENLENPCRQVIRLQGRILQVQDVDTPQTVGYGATYRVPGSGRLATVAVGYGDGYFSSLSGRGEAWLGEDRLPVVGRVSMDMLALDVSHLSKGAVKPGTLVDLIGPRNPIEAVAKKAGTIPYEVLTALGERYARQYVGET